MMKLLLIFLLRFNIPSVVNDHENIVYENHDNVDIDDQTIIMQLPMIAKIMIMMGTAMIISGWT